MNLKQHNNIVQKLIEQIESKDKQISTLNKQLNIQSKQINSQGNKTNHSTIQTQKLIQKKISQLNKQHQAKVAILNQQLKTLTQQNAQLKQRVNLKNQIQNKDRQRAVQVLKKNMIDRKPESKDDYRIIALISNYEEELGRKNAMIQTLKRQVKSLSTSNHEEKQQSKQQHQGEDNTNDSSNSAQRKGISLVEHNKTVLALNKELQSLNKRLKDRGSELQQLKTKYSQLTNEYYRIVNQSDVSDKQFVTQNINKKQPQKAKTSKFQQKNSFINVIEDDTLRSADNKEGDFSVSLAFEKNFKKFNSNRPKLNKLVQQQQQEQFDQLHQKQCTQQKLIIHNLNNQNESNSYSSSQPNQQLQSLVSSIIELLNITTSQQILSTINDLLIKTSFTQINEQITTALYHFLNNFGFGKMARTQMIDALGVLTQKCNQWIQSSDLLDEVCIEIGAQKHKLIEKIDSYKLLQQEYTQKMRTASFLNTLSKSEKLLEFINFFQLDKSDLELPQQLRNIYQQLKHVDKFVKLANSIMGVSQIKDNRSLQSTLDVILRKLERYSSWEIQLEKENQRKKINTKRKQSSTCGQTTIKYTQ